MSDSAKERLRKNLRNKLNRGEKSSLFSIRTKRLTAALACAVLVLIIAVSSVYYGYDSQFKVIPFDSENWVELKSSQGGGGEPSYPQGITGGLVGGYKFYYEVGERFTLRYQIEVGGASMKITMKKVQNGFRIRSVKKISVEESQMYYTYKNGEKIHGRKTTYELTVDVVSDEEEISGALKFQYGDFEFTIDLYGYNVDGKIFFANSGYPDSAFRTYIQYQLSQGFIQEEDIEELWNEFYRKHPSGQETVIFG